MFAKMLLTWGILLIFLTVQAESQYDPLGTDIVTIPTDLRRTSSLGDNDERVYLDPLADPLSIDPIMRQLDPQHTWEYLRKAGVRAYADPNLHQEVDLRGDWMLELKDRALRHLILFRFTLTVSKDYLSGSYYAFDAQGGVWTGTATGRRSV